MENWFPGKTNHNTQNGRHSAVDIRQGPLIECDFKTTEGERILEVQHFVNPQHGASAACGAQSRLNTRYTSYSMVDIRKAEQAAIASDKSVKKSNLKSYFSSLSKGKSQKSSVINGEHFSPLDAGGSSAEQTTSGKSNKNGIGTNKSFLTLTRLKAIKGKRRPPIPIPIDQHTAFFPPHASNGLVVPGGGAVVRQIVSTQPNGHSAADYGLGGGTLNGNGRIYEKFSHGSVSNERIMRLLRKSLSQNGSSNGGAAQRGGSVASRRSILEPDQPTAYDLLEEHFEGGKTSQFLSPHKMLAQRNSDSELYVNLNGEEKSTRTLIEQHFHNPTLAKSQTNLHASSNELPAAVYEDEDPRFAGYYDDVCYTNPTEEDMVPPPPSEGYFRREVSPRKPIPNNHSMATVSVTTSHPHTAYNGHRTMRNRSLDESQRSCMPVGNGQHYSNLSTFAKLQSTEQPLPPHPPPPPPPPPCPPRLSSFSSSNTTNSRNNGDMKYQTRQASETSMITNRNCPPPPRSQSLSANLTTGAATVGATRRISPMRKPLHSELESRQRQQEAARRPMSIVRPSPVQQKTSDASPPPPLPARNPLSKSTSTPNAISKVSPIRQYGDKQPIVNPMSNTHEVDESQQHPIIRKACSINGTVRMRRQDCDEPVRKSLSIAFQSPLVTTDSSNKRDLSSTSNPKSDNCFADNNKINNSKSLSDMQTLERSDTGNRNSKSGDSIGGKDEWSKFAATDSEAANCTEYGINGFLDDFNDSNSPYGTGTVRVRSRADQRRVGLTKERPWGSGSESTPSPLLTSDLSLSPSPTSPPLYHHHSSVGTTQSNGSNDSTPQESPHSSNAYHFSSSPYFSGNPNGSNSSSPPQFDCEVDEDSIQKTIIDTDSQEVHYSTTTRTSKISVITTNPAGQIKDKIVIDVPLGDIYYQSSAIEDSICDKIRNVVASQVTADGGGSGSSIVGDDYVEAPPDGDEPPVKSIFDGASKAEILEFLEDAKERVPEAIISADEILMRRNGDLIVVDGIPEAIAPPVVATKSWIEAATNNVLSSNSSSSSSSSNRRNRTSNVSNSSTDSALTSFSGTSMSTNSSVDIEEEEEDSSSPYSTSEGTIKASLDHSSHHGHHHHHHHLVLSSNLNSMMNVSASVGQLVERNDSGVGVETSKPAHLLGVGGGKNNQHNKLRRAASHAMFQDGAEHLICADCENPIETTSGSDNVASSQNPTHTRLTHFPLVCVRCSKKRTERKEIISEFADTENRYYRDLLIIKHEFYNPIALAQLVSKEQLAGIFLNLEELIEVSCKFSHRLREAIDIATELGDEDFTTINIGKIFMESTEMLDAFERYCIRQATSALLLHQLEKEKEMLRIFLRVSQMENNLLRRMNLSAFLMVPVQRVTKYPLLLNRLYKVTPHHHRDRDTLRESQERVGSHLQKINQHTKRIGGAPARFWRRVSTLSATLSASSRRMAKDLMMGGKKTL